MNDISDSIGDGYVPGTFRLEDDSEIRVVLESSDSLPKGKRKH